MESKPFSVYMIRNPFQQGEVKVGVTESPKARLRAFVHQHNYYGHSELVKKMRSENVQPTLLVLTTADDRLKANEIEQLICASLRLAGVKVLNNEGGVLARVIESNAIVHQPSTAR